MMLESIYNQLREEEILMKEKFNLYQKNINIEGIELLIQRSKKLIMRINSLIDILINKKNAIQYNKNEIDHLHILLLDFIYLKNEMIYFKAQNQGHTIKWILKTQENPIVC